LPLQQDFYSKSRHASPQNSSQIYAYGRNEYYLAGIIALLLQDHRTMSMRSVCSSQSVS